MTFDIHDEPLENNYFCTRFFAVALREKEWDEAYLNMYNQLKPGGYFQVLEPDNWVRKAKATARN